jgi:AraC-like DNA-binding protein
MLITKLNPEFAGKFLEDSANHTDPLIVAELLQHYMMKYLPAVEPIKYLEDALHLVYARHGNIEITELRQSIGMSERHFRRQFKRIIGLNPKKYCKIIQFNAVFEAIQTGNEKTLYDLALTNGYYDHAHFINDFKAYLGKSPRNFLRSEHSFLKTYLGTFRH